MQAATQKDESASLRDDAWVRPGPSARQRRNDVILALALAMGVVFSVELARSAGMSFGGAPPAMAEQSPGPWRSRCRWPCADSFRWRC